MKYNRYKGLTIIEVIIAIVIISTVLISVFSIIRSTQIRTQMSNFATDMTILVQNGIEIASDNLKNNWDAITPGDYKPVFDNVEYTWKIIPGEETNLDSKFTRRISIKSICRSTEGEIIQSDPCSGTLDDSSKKINVRVGWINPVFGSPIEAELLVIRN